MIRQSFTFDGVDSLDYGVYISGDAVFNAPVKAYEMVPIPGRSGDLAIYDGRYENLELTYPAFIFDDFKSNISGLRNELLSRHGYKRLTDTYHPDEFRLAVFQGGLEVNPVQVVTAGDFDIVFNCKPQRFLLEGEDPITLTKAGAVVNPTGFESRPLIKVNGTGTLTIGSDSVIIGGSATGDIYIDCDIMEAYTATGGVLSSYNAYVQFTRHTPPGLKPGSNGISFSGNISKVIITPRWFRL